MARPAAEQLRQFAFDALEEAIAQAELGPVRRTWALRLALGYLASLHPRLRSSGEPCRDFWRALSLDGTAMRLSALETALRVIYSQTDWERDGERAAVIREHAQLDEESLRLDRPRPPKKAR